jgi:DNA ligase (NAD+)
MYWRRFMDDSRIERMKELVGILNRAGKAYYVENQEIMSNLEYDRLYDELLSLERDAACRI